MIESSKPLEDADGIAAFDLDSTLRNPTKDIFGAIINGKLKRSLALMSALIAYARKMVGVDSRDVFAAKGPEIYQKILVENGVDRMQGFYTEAARNKERIHAGAIELLQELIARNIGIALITGSDEDFVKVFLEENGIDYENNVEILGSRYGKTLDGRSYSGEILQSHPGTDGKRRVVSDLLRKYPDKKLLIGAGDDEADAPIIYSVYHHGLRIVVGENEAFHRQLFERAYAISPTLHGYFHYDANMNVLQVYSTVQEGKLTFIDVRENLDKLIG